MRIAPLVLTFFLLGWSAWAETLRLSPQNEDVVLTARGEEILVDGHHGDIVISDSAGRVIVQGDHHDISIESASELIVRGHHNDINIGRVGAVILEGQHNDVVVTASRPVVTRGGAYNTLVSTEGVFENEETARKIEEQPPTEVVSSARRLTLEGAGITQTVEVEGQDVILNGARNHVKLVGRPTSITIDGAVNVVEVETTLMIRFNGAENTVRFRSGNPTVEDNGYNNRAVGP